MLAKQGKDRQYAKLARQAKILHESSHGLTETEASLNLNSHLLMGSQAFGSVLTGNGAGQGVALTNQQD